MNEHIKKIVTSINGIEIFSRRIIKHGVQLALGLLCIALALYFINTGFYNYDYDIAFMTFSIFKTGVTIFAEAIIGGLLIDYFIKKLGSSN